MPGQIVNPIIDQTLGDYIARKQRQDAFDVVVKENKLTFDQWWDYFSKRYSLDNEDSLTIDFYKLTTDFYKCWKTAQENK